MKLLILLLLLFGIVHAASMDKRVKVLENTILDLEIKSLQSMINLSGELLNEVGYFNTSKGYSGKENDERKYLTSSLYLNANSTLNTNLSVYTTMQGSFFYGQNIADTEETRNGMTDQVFGDSLKIVKAYFDYAVFSKRLVLSMGRLPTTLGPPAHLYNNTKRSGTYPLMAYSIPVDGVGLTGDIWRSSNRASSLIFRSVYAPLTRIDKTKPSYLVEGKSSTGTTGTIASDDSLLMGMLEFNTKSFPSIGRNILFILQYFHADFNRQKPVTARLPNVADPDGSALYEIYFSNDSIMEISSYISYLEIESLLQTNLDFYASFKLSDTQSKAQILAKMLEKNASAVGNVGDVTPLGQYWLSHGREVGGSLLVGGRYRFSKKVSLGAEFLINELGAFPATFHASRVTDFYTTVGKGVHVYLGAKVASGFLHLRVGYSNMLSDYDFTVGESFNFTRSKRRKEQLYLQGRIFF